MSDSKASTGNDPGVPYFFGIVLQYVGAVFVYDCPGYIRVPCCQS